MVLIFYSLIHLAEKRKMKRRLSGGVQPVAWLTRRGMQNVLVCHTDSEIQNADAQGAVIHAISIRDDLGLELIRRPLAIARAESPDIVYIHSRRGADIFGGIAARLAGVPCVLSRRVDNVEPR